MLENYARDVFTGAGTIVDLGCWYGATTLSLARGLAKNRFAAPHRVIEAFDLFQWETWMDSEAKRCSLPRHYGPGADFYEDVKQLLSPYSDVVRLKRQDLLTYAPAPTPVEFLFIDAMKSWELAQKIVSDFFPLLIANRSYVVQQDFAFYHAAVATNHLVMWLLRDHFAFVHHVPRSCSVLFRCTKPCEVGHLPSLDPNSFTVEMIEEAYAYSSNCVSPEMRPRLEVAQLGFLIEQGHAAAAQNKMKKIAREEWSIPMVAELRRAVQARLAIESAVPDQRQIEWLHEINLWALQSEKEKMSRRGV
jgi:hypothetical protein